MTGATHHAWAKAVRDESGERPQIAGLETFCSGQAFQIGDIEVTPFTIPHDAADPVGFTFRTEGAKVGLVTDLGYLPPNVTYHLRGCDVLVVESNHDVEMLRNGPYPWSVKERVKSRVGHLSNGDLAKFFRSDYDGYASYIVLAHLSEQNNLPELARRAAEEALGRRRNLLRNRLLLATQSEPMETIQL
jgi:phosphoribosyl 1,2-cyclic phosphodiesterase